MTAKKLFLRIHRSFTASAERRTLWFLARQMPAFVTPDLLTATGVVGGLIVCAGYALSNQAPAFLWLANLGLVIHWFGDSLDGTLARLREIERPRYGYFLDQTVDALTNFLICLGIGWSPYVSFGVAMVALAGYHMVSIYAFVRNAVTQEFVVSSLGIGPTEIRLGIIGMNIAILAIGVDAHEAWGIPFTWCDIAVLMAGLGFMIAFVCHVAVFARILRRRDEDEARDGLF